MKMMMMMMIIITIIITINLVHTGLTPSNFISETLSKLKLHVQVV